MVGDGGGSNGSATALVATVTGGGWIPKEGQGGRWSRPAGGEIMGPVGPATTTMSDAAAVVTVTRVGWCTQEGQESND